MIGRTLAHYRIDGLLGKGGMGEVYRAHDTKLGRDVALKVLPPELAATPERRARFEREARAVAALRHPGIVTIHSIEEADGVRFLTMELVDGEPLSSRVRPGGLDAESLLRLAIPLAEAVGAAHAKGITHRDLKPANVVIDASGRVMVLDFGIAKLSASEDSGEDAETRLQTDAITQSGGIVGTVHYMSPEQAEGKPVDPRSDVFSLGIVLYELATGERPYRGSTPISVLSSILRDDPPPVAERNAALPADLERIVRRCLEKDPARRYANAAELCRELESVRDEWFASRTATGLSGTRDVVSPPTDARPGPRRPARVVWALAGIAALFAIVFGPRLFGPRGGPEPPPPPEQPEGVPATSPATGPGIGASGRPSLAVFRFEDRTGDQEVQWLSSGVPAMLITGLAQTPGLDLVSSQRVESILHQIGRENAERIDQAILDAISQQAGAGAVVVGSIFKSGDTIRIDVQVEDVDTGRVLLARNASGTEVFPLVDQLALDIRRGLELSGGPDPSPVTEVTSPSLEAWESYEQGVRAYEGLRLSDAVSSFEHAIALDENFALARARLAATFSTLGDEDRARRYRDAALAQADRLPERFRMFLEAGQAVDEGDEDRAIEIYERLIERFPDESQAYVSLNGVVGSKQGNIEAGLALLERGVRANPQSPSLRNAYAYRLRDLGRYTEAIRELEVYRRLEPEEPNPWDSLGELYLVVGQPERALENYARALEIDPRFRSAYSGRALALASLGRFDEALAELTRWEQRAMDRDATLLGLDKIRGRIYVAAGRYEEARRAMERSWALDRTFDNSMKLGAETSVAKLFDAELAFRDRDWDRAARLSGESWHEFRGNARDAEAVRSIFAEIESASLARLGRFDEALALASALDTLATHPAVAEMSDRLRGEVALARGELDRAEDLFRSGAGDPKKYFVNLAPLMDVMLRIENPPLRDWEARLDVARGDLAGAIAKYSALNTPGLDNPFVSIFEPLYVLEEARLLDRQGDRSAAKREYARFLEFWKNADAGRPEVAEAREYVGRG
ncbi:MAG: protein kinase [bacterium]